MFKERPERPPGAFSFLKCQLMATFEVFMIWMGLRSPMQRRVRQLLLLPGVFFTLALFAQTHPPGNVIALVSDTQAPMWIETLWLKENHNTDATRLIFSEITKSRPVTLFILGDVVSLSKKESRWVEMDRYLAALRSNGIPVHALLGNHDVMRNAKKGEASFNKRFPDHVRTGYLKIVDSIAFVLLNSNISKLSPSDASKQEAYYKTTLQALDGDPAVKVIVVSCHHAPYSNSKIVGSSVEVQEKFVPEYIQSRKARLFVTGHAHDFEWFQFQGKDFLTLGGGGGLHQPLRSGKDALPNRSLGYAPEFHYELMERNGSQLKITSYRLKPDFSGFEKGYELMISPPGNQLGK